MTPEDRSDIVHGQAGFHGRRVAVVGTSGSGKSTVAAALARSLGVAHVELDAIHHQAGWIALPRDQFVDRVASLTEADGWVVDGGYSAVVDLVWSRADTIVWLDLPRWSVMRQVMGRTLRRIARREVLWNGNRERWRNLCDPRPEENIILWAWTTWADKRRRYRTAMTDPRWAHLAWHRLGSRAAVEAFMASVAAGTPSQGSSPSTVASTRPRRDR